MSEPAPNASRPPEVPVRTDEELIAALKAAGVSWTDGTAVRAAIDQFTILNRKRVDYLLEKAMDALQERLGEELCTDAEVRQVVLRLAAIFASDRVPPPTNVLILGIGGNPPDDR